MLNLEEQYKCLEMDFLNLKEDRHKAQVIMDSQADTIKELSNLIDNLKQKIKNIQDEKENIEDINSTLRRENFELNDYIKIIKNTSLINLIIKKLRNSL
jgi:uncharacterized protein YPO0396